MKLKFSDYISALFSGLVCYGLIKGIPVWALFFGWAWYGAAKGGLQAIKSVFFGMMLGYLAGFLTVFVGNLNSSIHLTVLTVGLMVLGMYVLFKTKLFSNALAAFGAYSCLFAGYASQQFPVMETTMIGDIPNILRAIGWFALANVLGMCTGYIIDILVKRFGEKGDVEPLER